MMRDATTDRRIRSRVAVAVDVHLARKVGNAVAARTLDLSVDGALVVSERPLRVDERLRFGLDLPDAAGHLDGTARVLRQRRHDTFALRFEKLEPAGVRELGAFVARASAQDS